MPNCKKPRRSFPFKRLFQGMSYSNTLNNKILLNHGKYLKFTPSKALEGQNILPADGFGTPHTLQLPIFAERPSCYIAERRFSETTGMPPFFGTPRGLQCKF